MLLDAHCHVDRFPNPIEVLRAARAADVQVVAVTELPSGYQRLALTLGRHAHVSLAVGIHPLRAGRASALEMRLFDRLCDQASWIGEVGLDFSVDGKPTRRRQIEVFERILAHSRIRQKVLSVHSRRAERDTVRRLTEARVRAVLHWYTGPLGVLDDALAAGLFFSVNPAMLRSKNGQKILDRLPVDRVLVETDGPHTRIGGRRAEPHDAPWLVDQLASRWRLPYAEAAAQIVRNAEAAVRLPQQRQLTLDGAPDATSHCGGQPALTAQ